MWNRKLSVVAGGLACLLVLGVAGCGNEPAGESTGGAGSASADSKLAAPITFLRTGGLAGFHDELTVHPDGKVTLQGRRGEPYRCSVPRPMLTKLSDAASGVRLKAGDLPESDAEPMPDELFTSVRIDGTEYDSSVAEDDEALLQVFTLMHDLLRRTTDARDAGRSDCA